MNPQSHPDQPLVNSQALPFGREVIWHHPAFCRLALPLRAPRATWVRTVSTASVTIESGASSQTLPAGELLRALLLFICDVAVRTGNSVVGLGENAAVLALQLGRPALVGATAEQMRRILAATIRVSIDGGPHRAMFDKRALPRNAEPAWRTSVRLNESFQTDLMRRAIPLDKLAIDTLRDMPMALDAHAWTRQALHCCGPGRVVSASWGELHASFAASSQDLKVFKPLFEAALQRAADADPALELQIRLDKVNVVVVASKAREGSGTQASLASLPFTPENDDPARPPAQPAIASSSPNSEPAKPASESQSESEDRAFDAPSKSGHLASAAEPAASPAPLAKISPVPETLSLRSELTGLPYVIWLRRGFGVGSALIGVTPGAHFDADRATLLAVEPLIIQVSGGLAKSDFDQISAWITVNRDLIDDIWAGSITSFGEIRRRIRKAPALDWR